VRKREGDEGSKNREEKRKERKKQRKEEKKEREVRKEGGRGGGWPTISGRPAALPTVLRWPAAWAPRKKKKMLQRRGCKSRANKNFRVLETVFRRAMSWLGWKTTPRRRIWYGCWWPRWCRWWWK